jgi:DNA-binding transcriptional LysR family regulator
MELVWLQDFLALANAGSFSRAAEQRNVTQPAFSRRIHSLEQWMNVELFDRSTHPVSLTYVGQWFRPIAEELVHRILVSREEAQAVSEDVAATLHFAATHALSWSFFPAWLHKLEDRMSRLHVGPTRLISDTLHACEDLMVQGRVQFLLCHHHESVANRLEPSGFQSAVVGRDVLIPVATPKVLRKLDAKSGWDGSIQLLSYSKESGLGQIVRALRESSKGIGGFKSEFTSHLAVVLKGMALEGRGVAWLPQSLIQDELRSNQLDQAGFGMKSIPVEIRLFRRRSSESGRAESFWQLVERDASTKKRSERPSTSL